MRLRLLITACAALMLSIGCTQRTQVVVIVEADEVIQNDSAVHHVHLYVRAAAPGRLEGAEVSQDMELPGTWPRRFVLTPLGEGPFDYTERSYEVVVAAHRRPPMGVPETIDTASIVSARVRSGYVRGQTRVLVLRLERACRDRPTLCAAEERCAAGECVPIYREPESLPTLSTYQTDAGPADAYLPPGTDAFGLDAWAPDAWTPERPDAAIDAFVEPSVDAGIDAFVEPPDAHVPMGVDAYAPDAFMPMPLGRFTSITPLPASGAPFNTGWSVAISDTNLIAVGAPGSADYLYDVTRPLTAPRALPYSTDVTCGQSAAINAAGTVAAFGCPSTNAAMLWQAPTWALAGVPLRTGFGNTLAMDESGSRLAFGGTDEITIRRGGANSLSVIPGITIYSLDLSDDGTLLVAGVRNTALERDEVRTYTVTDTELTQVGAALVTDEGFGVRVALSGDGNTLAVLDSAGSAGPVVSIYRRAGSAWSSPRSLPPGVSFGLFGSSLALNADGTRIAVGAPGERAPCFGICPEGTVSTTTGPGAVYIYDGVGTPVNYIRPPDDAGNAFGISVALNRAGTRLVIGEPNRVGGGAVYLVE